MNDQLLKRRLPKVTTRQLWHFVAAAETGKLAEAGRLLHMAPSAISTSISELETTLGVQLCVRHKAKGVVLTPSGEAALTLARNLITDLIDFETAFNGEDEAARAPLTIGCFSSLAPLVLPATQSAFSASYPNAAVEFIEESHEDLQQRLLEGTIDMAFLYDLDIDHRLQRIPVMQLRPSVLLPGDHPLAGHDAPAEIPFHAIGDESFIIFSGSPLYEQYLRIFADEGFTPHIAQSCRNVGTVRAFVGRGAGIALAYEKYDLQVTVENLQIAVKPLVSRAAQPLDICLVLPRGAKPSMLSRYWIDTAHMVLGDDRTE